VSGAIMMLNFSYLTNLSMLYGSDFTEKVFAGRSHLTGKRGL
jgi:hypothetical protein